MNEEASVLDAIKANPEDLVFRLVYADWLEDRGDARSEYLRVDAELQGLIHALAANESATEKIRQLQSRLRKLGKTLDSAWTDIFDALRPRLFRCRTCRKVLSAKDAINTNPRNYRKMKTSRYCKVCYEDAVRSQLQRGLESSGGRSSAERDYHGGSSEDD